MLIIAFALGINAIQLDLVIVNILNWIWEDESVFYSAFCEAGIPEEFCKWILFMLVIWRNRNFNESFDGIVYACFIGLGFACVENILYVFNADGFLNALGTGLLRALLSVPAHFLFAVIMGYFLSEAKYYRRGKVFYLILSLLIPMFVHGLFDYILMFSDNIENELMIGVLYHIFIGFDILLWIFGIRSIRRMQENSRIEHNNEIIEEIFKS